MIYNNSVLNVVKVGNQLKITGLSVSSNSTLTIRAHNGVMTSVGITVEEKDIENIPVTSLSLNNGNNTITMSAGETSSISYVLLPYDATDRVLNITGYDTDIISSVTQNDDGSWLDIEAIAAGFTTIGVTTSNNISATLFVTVSAAGVVNVTDVVFPTSHIQTSTNMTVYAPYTILPHNATDKTLTISSFDGALIKSVVQDVENNRLIIETNELNNSGFAYINITTSNGITRSITVDISAKVDVLGIVDAGIVGSPLFVDVDQFGFGFGTEIVPFNATNKNVSYIRDEEKLYAYNLTGGEYHNVKALVSGEHLLTVKTEDGGFEVDKMIVTNDLVTLGIVRTPIIVVGQTNRYSVESWNNNTNEYTYDDLLFEFDDNSLTVALVYLNPEESVDKAVEITANVVGKHQVIIKTADNVLKATMLVNVIEPISVTGIMFNETEDVIVGSASFINGTIEPFNASNTDLTFSYDEDKVIVGTATSNGSTLSFMVETKEVGDIPIVITTVDGGFTQTCTLKSKEFVPVEEIILPMGDSYTFKKGDVGDSDTSREYQVLPEDATSKVLNAIVTKDGIIASTFECYCYLEFDDIYKIYMSSTESGNYVITLSDSTGSVTKEINVTVTD